MAATLESTLREALCDSLLAESLPITASPLLERRGGEPVGDLTDGLRGLARAVATNLEAARYVGIRTGLLERIGELTATDLEERAATLEAAATPPACADPDDLEDFIDAIRLARRDESLVAACALFGNVASFDSVSAFLSRVAETCVRWALDGAESRNAARSGLAILGMGKIAGRELTFHSDLDVIFLYSDASSDPTAPARTAQRWIAYLSQLTATGTAFAIDSRLRPSGRKGALVTTTEAFVRYQRDQAATWEHLALMRSRAIADPDGAAERALAAARAGAFARGARWPDIAEMRARVEAERTPTQGVAFKTTAGGLMDVDFLATGALLERSAHVPVGVFPSVPAMLRARAPEGPARARLLSDYAFVRELEAAARWQAGRGSDSIELEGDAGAALAELVEPGARPEELASRLNDALVSTRAIYARVITAGTIEALDG